MSFFADLHVHSRYSRATSKDSDLEHLACWALRKGLSVVGTGDFTHPEWISELKEKLIPAEPGLFRLRPDLEQAISDASQSPGMAMPRFMLQAEISTIYKKDDRTRKAHHLIYAPRLGAAEAINQRLGEIGNLTADGRPILGLDSRDLLEIVLEAGPDAYLVPAHIWTPWFSVLGSKSGFDSIEACYEDLTPHIFALETGLSSDPEMNWLVSSLDRYRLVSNSDAHSPSKLARECTRFDAEMDYFSMRRALESGKGYGGTVEFFPEEGKYHADGHRKCGVRFNPEETKAHEGSCPVCGKPLTIGVLYRVHELADRAEPVKPEGAADFRRMIPLKEVLSELLGAGPQSQRVTKRYEEVISGLGSELGILALLPLEEISDFGWDVLAEAIRRMREGQVISNPGYDGEYGVIRLFSDDELKGEREKARAGKPRPKKESRLKAVSCASWD